MTTPKVQLGGGHVGRFMHSQALHQPSSEPEWSCRGFASWRGLAPPKNKRHSEATGIASLRLNLK